MSKKVVQVFRAVYIHDLLLFLFRMSQFDLAKSVTTRLVTGKGTQHNISRRRNGQNKVVYLVWSYVFRVTKRGEAKLQQKGQMGCCQTRKTIKTEGKLTSETKQMGKQSLTNHSKRSGQNINTGDRTPKTSHS